MTTMAALLGAPAGLLGAGIGAELRRPLGISIIGGLIVSQLLTLYTTPVVYLYFDPMRLWWRGGHGKHEEVRAGFCGLFLLQPRDRFRRSRLGSVMRDRSVVRGETILQRHP